MVISITYIREIAWHKISYATGAQKFCRFKSDAVFGSSTDFQHGTCDSWPNDPND
jgi:hypothetical protein